MKGLREMYGYLDPKTEIKRFNLSNCFNFDELTGCTLLRYGHTKILKQN